MRIEPKTRAFLDTLAAAGGPPIYTLAPDAARAVLDTLQAGPTPSLPVDAQDLVLSVGPTGKVPVRVLRPQGAAGPLPAIVYLHGGGWILGDRQTHDRLAREIALGAGAVVFLVDYDRAPEAPYPLALEQCYAVTRHVADNGHRLNIDPTRLAVCGDSAGGPLAIGVALLVKERGGPRIGFQLLLYPVTDANLDTGSYREFADGPWLTRAGMKWFWDAYIPDPAVRSRPTASPLRAELSGLPPTLVLTAENDVLRDEGEAYVERLWAAGVPAGGVRVLGAVHDFLMLNGLRDTPPARTALQQGCAALRAAFYGAPVGAPARELVHP